MYYCDICHKTIMLKPKNRHPKSLTHNELEKSIHIDFSIENPNFFNVDKKLINILRFKKTNFTSITLKVILT